MASSNRNWPSMFKSKPYNTHNHQWQHDVNSSLMSNGCHRPSYTTVPGCEERSPEPKPRWNPKPEQIRILEAIFNSGMVNPPRDEIRRIRAQLQEYGQVGDANVFYWFQNRKSRSKQKLRHLQNSKQQSNSNQNPQITSIATTTLTAPSSSSSSSEKSSPSTGSNKRLSLSSPNFLDVSNSPTGSVNQTYFQAHNEFLTEPLFSPIQQTGGGLGLTQGFGFSELSNIVQGNQQQLGPCTSLLLSEIMNHGAPKKYQPEDTLSVHPQPSNYTATTVPSTLSIAPTPLPTTTVTVPYTINPIQGVGESYPVVGHGSAAKSTVFINDVAFDVAAGPFNVREAFGEDAVLINSSGQPVLTNEWGVTLQSLNHGAFYYLVRTLSPASSV